MYSQTLQSKILNYYLKYYNSCGLRDSLSLAKKRLNEEITEAKRMERLEEILGIKFDSKQHHFIFGAGTGGLAVFLNQEFGCSVSGIEPSKDEFEIIQMKLEESGIKGDFRKEYGEELSFEDNQFDVVHCFTVLEHVKDVEKCISEMIRITKPGGFIYINTPDYGFPEERHYKLRWPVGPAYLPRFLNYLYLFFRGRPIDFLKTINLLTKKRLKNILSRFDGIEYRFLGSGRTQEVVIKKDCNTA